MFVLVGNNVYINLDQSLVKLFLNLYFKMRPFSFLERKAARSMFNRVPQFIIRAVRAIQFVYKFYCAKYKSDNTRQTVETNYFGHFLLNLRNGEIKVFDLEKQIVTTVFGDRLSISEVEKQIRNAKKSEECRLTPGVICYSLKKRCITEKYINGSRPIYDLDQLTTFYNDVFPLLSDILTSTKPKRVSFSRVIKDKYFALESQLYHLEFNCSIRQGIEPVRNFLKTIHSQLEEKPHEGEMDLVLSHGDLWEGNILMRNGRNYVIDWTTLGTRSVYFDFYYAMFMLASKNTHFDTVNKNTIKKLNRELDNGCRLFFEKLKQEGTTKTIKTTDQFMLYRYLFYLELIHLKLIDIQVDQAEEFQEVITWVNRFKVLEEMRGLTPSAAKR
ncbi:Phosphotransferase enzyme family protein [Lentibacillus persicus]|uniref:Phosphotransferase enzyme family protein n=1 Tax=Lentibacillus persicus TaxID=640948 RepID=A0A1I1U855_9BACI|nr:Phosphotransferase enzyme family protein [Lentibacillus persicus]